MSPLPGPPPPSLLERLGVALLLAELLKPHGYMTGQFGKNHLGDLDEHLPTIHGFDEFFGNLYHLNIEEEPELPDYPTGALRDKIAPRGVIRSTAGGAIEDTGPLTSKRMETVDEEFLAATVDFIKRAHQAEKPFFVWFSATRMHVFTHLKPESEGVTGHGIYPDGMVEHDQHVGVLLYLLDELDIGDDLGRWLSGARRSALARQDPGRQEGQRYRASHGLAPHVHGRRRGPRHQAGAAPGAPGR